MGRLTHRSLRVSVVGAALLATNVACGGSSTPIAPAAPAAQPAVDPSVLPSMDVMVAEKSLGSASAPHTIVEYSSFTCPHCSDFDVVFLPQLKTKYIDRGSVQFIFRNSPRDETLDLTAAMLARCSGDRYFDAVHTLFANQGQWAASVNPPQALETLMRNFGMSQQVIDACKASTPLRDAVLKMKADGLARYHYTGVPAFIVDATHLVEGITSLSDLEQFLK